MFRLPLPALLCGFIAMPAHAGEPPLTTVTVTAKKPSVSKELDKTVHRVSGMARAENGTAQDVLQSLPGITVAADGAIAVQGNRQVTVLVDGKPTAGMSGEERAAALQTMSGAAIASVEVITNPSAAQHADGGAIVNIVLKRNRKAGAHAQLRGGAADHGLWNLGATADASGGNVSVHGEVARRHDGTLKTRGSRVDWTYPASGGTGHTRQASEVFVRRIVETAALGLDYDVSASDSIGLAARHQARRSRPRLDTLNVVGTGGRENVYHRISEGPNEQSDDSVSVTASHAGDGTALKAVLQHSETVGLIDKSFSDVFADARATAYSRGATRSTRRLDQATLDWSRGPWGSGIDIQHETQTLDNYQAAVDHATGIETPDPATTNGYAVATTLSAGYVTRQVTHGKWEALLGARLEHMALRVHPLQGPVHRAQWQAVDPSLHVKHAATTNADVTLSYRRSLQRPDPRDLNPFTTYVDAQNLSRGNPTLGPQRVAAWEIGTDVHVAHLTGRVGAFHRTSRDMVADVRSIEGGVIVTGKRNGGLARSAGVTGSLDWEPNTALSLGIDGGVYRVVLLTPDLEGPVRQSGVAGYLNLRAAWRGKVDDVSLDAHALSAGMTPLVRYGATSNVNVTWKRRLTPTLSLTVNASDLFDGSRRTYRTTTSTFRQQGFEHFVARRLQVGFVQRFK
ncbi:outer membrane receptor protein involved in Fe transport [Pseudoduganella flava]|uniref:Outer membrane receptor protein involved in Fe transport n=1 Tax=Pseudoduganella flava TaxID=871742 RepID=A0A562PGH7_9BURK|nr:TonB-dependent receptor [Pseudoduganella flava]QGZ40386.1 TonB-dependent receptor [Pseudoduganella flava]TWI43582.1 outer membrane receptor protein involved in Fe transport [Pseudoduganella flava]